MGRRRICLLPTLPLTWFYRFEQGGTMNERSVSLKPFALLVAIAFAGVVVVNALANALPLNGYGTGVLSDMIPNLFVPAGLTFAIWGLIYLLLALYVAVVLQGAFGKGGAGRWGRADGVLFCVNALFNMGWIFAWHWRAIWLSMLLMLGILATLVALLERAHAAAPVHERPIARFALTVPVQVYLGWICVATIANATALLVTAGWDGFGLAPEFWTVLVIAAGLGIGAALLFLRDAWASALVVVWAYAGIVNKRVALDGWGPVAIAASAAAVVMLALVAVKVFVPRVARGPQG